MKRITGSGFVIDKTRINDNKLIIKVLNKNDQQHSFVYRKGKRLKSSPNYLDFIDFVFIDNSKSSLSIISETFIHPSFKDRPLSEIKLDYFYFIADVLRYIGNRVEIESGLYQLLQKYHGALMDELSPDLLIVFLIDLLNVFGVCPVYESNANYLDFREGSFCLDMPPHSDFCEAKLFHVSAYFTNENSSVSVNWNASMRFEFISLLIRYFEFQKGISLPIKSLEILRDLRK